MPPESKPVERPIVPLEFAGKWIAWNREGTRIVASGQTFQEVVDAAKAVGEDSPIFEKIRRLNQRCVSLRRPMVTPHDRRAAWVSH